MIEPNRLTVPGEPAARARVEELFERIDALGAGFAMLPVPRLDLESREIELDELAGLADRHGRGALLDEARQRVRDAVLVRTATRVEAVVGQRLLSSGSVEDQVARLMAIEDAVSVAVVEDLLDPATAVALSSPGRQLLGLAPLDLPARSPSAALGGDEAPPGGPEAADDEETTPAEDADAEADEAAAQDALRQRRAVLFVIVAAVALPAAFAAGVGLPGVLVIGLALLFCAWLFA